MKTLHYEALLKGECLLSAKTGKEKKPKKYHYFTKTIPLPDGTRKYIRAKTQEELDQKVLEAQMLMRPA